MSNLIENRVWTESRTKLGDRLLMVCIADQADDDGIAWPGLKNLCARMGGVTKRAVQLQLNRLHSTGELLIYPRTRQSHMFIVAVGMTSTQLKHAIRELAKRRRISTMELAKTRRVKAGKPVGVVKKIHQGVVKKIHQGDESRFTRVMNPDSPGWITPEYKHDPRSVKNHHMIQLPSADALESGQNGNGSETAKTAIQIAVMRGSFDLPPDISLDRETEFLISRILNWLGQHYPRHTEKEVQGFYRWYAEARAGASAPRDLARFGAQYHAYANRSVTPQRHSSYRLMMSADDPLLATMSEDERAQIQVLEAPMSEEERQAAAELMERLLNGKAER